MPMYENDEGEAVRTFNQHLDWLVESTDLAWAQRANPKLEEAPITVKMTAALFGIDLSAMPSILLMHRKTARFKLSSDRIHMAQEFVIENVRREVLALADSINEIIRSSYGMYAVQELDDQEPTPPRPPQN